MAVAVMNFRKAYICLSTDVKPASPSNGYALLYESDTGLWYAWNGSAWVAYSGA